MAAARSSRLETLAAADRGRLEAGAVVVDLQQTGDGLVPQRDTARRRAGMASHVRQRFACELYDVRSHGRQSARGLRVDLDDRDHAGLRLELLGDRPQRGVKLALGEDHGPQAEDVVPEIADHVSSSSTAPLIET